ncbi:MAG: extracellular solute-binding protein [Beutenbergiaceae bacterium]
MGKALSGHASRRAFLAATVAGFGAAATGCAVDTQAPAIRNLGHAPVRATIRVWADPVRAQPLAQLGQQCQQQRGIAVDVESMDSQQIAQQLLTGEPQDHPDLAVVGHDWLAELIAAQRVSPMAGRNQELLPPAQQAFDDDEHTYGLALDLESLALIRNDALTDAQPETWDALLESHPASPVLIPQQQPGDPYHLYPFQGSFGAPVLNWETRELSADQFLGADYFSWLAANGSLGNGILAVSPGPEEALEAFLAGEAPFLLTGPWHLRAIREALSVSVLPIPAAGPVPATPFVGVRGVVLPAASTQPDMAQEFCVNYVDTEPGLLAIQAATGRVPATSAAADLASADDPIAAGLREAAATGVLLPPQSDMNIVVPHWAMTQADVISGTASDPAAAWITMIDRWVMALG